MKEVSEWVRLEDSPGEDFEAGVIALGESLFTAIGNETISFFDPKRYTGKLMDWAMADEAFRVALFRFVDVLPSLDSSAAVMRHVQDYFGPVADRFPGLTRWGLGLNPESLAAKGAALFVRQQIESMAHQFILGASSEKALKPLRKLRKSGLAFTVDLLGETCVSDAEAAIYQERYAQLLRTLGRTVPTWDEAQALVPGHRGERCPVHISVKLSALDAQAKAVAMEKTVERLAERLATLFRLAREQGASVTVDMEDTAKVDFTLRAFKRVLEDPEFRDWPDAGCVLQAYLRRTPADLESLLDWVKARETPINVRLVKGAYWDTETIQAQLARWPIPVWQSKCSSDAAYEECARRLIDHNTLIHPAFASHNLRSLAYAIEYARYRGVPKTHYELQALFGMADPIKRVLVQRGFLVREYAPVGELLPGMAYLVRRLLENTSNAGFIRQGFKEAETVSTLLKAPARDELGETGAAYLEYDPRKTFHNAPLRDFTKEEARGALADALKVWTDRPKEDFGRIHPVVNGAPVLTSVAYLASDSPDDPEYVVANVGTASAGYGGTCLGRTRSGLSCLA
jgi:RHH-type proline utilization regulon transcriptional repressor/proline dehydrogenase/delta 1-pyrroline-5-carboxylate dehydrogenase